MGTALKAGEEQEGNEPKNDNHSRGHSDDTKPCFTAGHAEDAAIKEQSTDFNAGQSAG